MPLLPLAITLAALQADADQHRPLLDRIQAVETGGTKDPAHAVGDRGLARGWMQMHPDYYADARKECPELPDYRTACASREWSRLAVCAYWRRHRAKTDRDRALLHHYGPLRGKGIDRDGYLFRL